MDRVIKIQRLLIVLLRECIKKLLRGYSLPDPKYATFDQTLLSSFFFLGDIFSQSQNIHSNLSFMGMNFTFFILQILLQLAPVGSILYTITHYQFFFTNLIRMIIIGLYIHMKMNSW